MSSIFERAGGREMLMAVSKKFYDKIYMHPWLKEYFKDVKQGIIESQQVDFMTGALGGPKIYCGRNPTDAHLHINITEELFQVRKQLLIEAMEEVNASAELRDRWLKVDDAFKGAMIKKLPEDCVKRWATDEILDFPNPAIKKIS
jgi:truncated hemoglobin YjbI